jgi:hypothetical protein
MAPMVTIAYKGGLGFNNITAGVHHRGELFIENFHDKSYNKLV